MSVLMRSISGIRGIVGDPLTPPLLLEYLNAFIQVTQAKKVIIGRDTRVTGSMIESIIAQGCAASGVEAVSLGIASTPTVEVMVPHLHADGGIIVTASHNPGEWNALKFLNKEGIFLNEAEIQRLFEIVDGKKFKWANYQEIKKATEATGADDIHIQGILDLPLIDVEGIKKRNFKVAYDGVNGAGCFIVPQLLKALGCTTHSMYVEPSGIFPHNPEPTPENLSELSQLIQAKGCDVGFATDPDGDRCAVVSESGKTIGEEYTLVFAAMLQLSHHKGPMTVNLSTSRMIEDLALANGVSLERSKVGEINVSMLMKDNKSVIGGEGNGGVILPDLHYGRDGMLAIAMVLQLMLQEEKTISELVKRVPAYHIEKQKFAFKNSSLDSLAQILQDKFKGAELNQEDGLRFAWSNKWVHVRPSNTEPVLRIISEAPTKKEALELCKVIELEIE